MSVWKRARLYLVRKKVRSAFLFLILFFAGTLLLAGAAVRMGADASCEEMRKSLISGIKIQVKLVDRNEFYEITKNEKGQEVSYAKGDIFTRTALEKIMDFEGVSGYYMQRGGYELYTGLETVPGNNAASLKEGYYREPRSKEEAESIEQLNKSARLQAKSLAFHPVAEGKWEPSFLNGALHITEGRNIERTDQRKAVISESIAEKNGLSVGDTITARNYDFVLGELYGSAMELEIVGIYRMNFKQAYSPENTYEDMIMENVAFCDNEIVEWSSEEYHEQQGLLRGILVGKAAEHVGNVRIYVEDPKRLSDIKERILAMDEVDWSLYDMEYDDSDYRAAAGPLLLIRKLFTAFLVILSAGTLIILFLVLSMWIRGRNYEIGILISIGTKKRTIFTQLLLECGAIAAAAFLLAAIASQPVTAGAKHMVEEWFSAPAPQEEYSASFEMSRGTFEIHKAASGPVVLQQAAGRRAVAGLFCVMLPAVMGAALYSAAKIVNQKPKEILTKK